VPRKRKTPPDGRVNSGGQRQPTAGKSYTNRRDLQSQPAQVSTGQAYGEATAQREALRVVPMAGAPALPAPAGPSPGGGGGVPGPAPGGFGDFARPTERPDEPLTAGADGGLGPGPEALARNQTAGRSADDQADYEALAPYLPQLELMVNLPGTSVAARNFVRRVRGAMRPPTGPQ
jgi:hypothetical protein